jgi:hypothetical protein
MQSPREGERAVSWPDSVWTRREFPHPARTVWATHGQHPCCPPVTHTNPPLAYTPPGMVRANRIALHNNNSCIRSAPLLTAD